MSNTILQMCFCSGATPDLFFVVKSCWKSLFIYQK